MDCTAACPNAISPNAIRPDAATGGPDDAARTADPCGHARSVSGMFGRIADWYDLLNRVLSGGLDRYWRYRLVRHVAPGPTGRVLDLAAGTLDVSLEIVRQHPGARVPALDFCRPMLQRGRGKLSGETARAIWPATADGRRLPLADASVDCVTIAFGIRNILPRSEAFAEILRVLVPGGRLCVLEFGTGKTPVWRGLYNFYLNRVLPMVGRAVSGDSGAYRYLADTIMAFPTADELAGEMAEAGFGRVFHLPLTSGIVRLHVAEKPRAAETAPAVAAPTGDEPAPAGATRNKTTAKGGAASAALGTEQGAAQGTLPGAATRETPKKKRASGGAKAGKKTR
ncbi:ubiquinone/menaquinone biosynthesis methyltransferase [Nitratidesulfovibrio sp. 1201_IL3209]|jgi:demethylmenaquinone methyltransferase/2-methoxy-6-polyprenyl-1,4-benzoquinol methylase|uniref:ubiquinone/menaquinone biosynthesis methyltransferase n=1 Tax=Nitratidesulfovibrio sp. 1201_IL3209 TaxID=3084053 RepID=UPI002FD8F60C